MFAVIKTGGKQYKVAAEDTITVMTLPGEAGARIVFDEVLALFDGATNHVGAPRVAGASVVGEIVEQARGPKVYAFKKRRRKNSKRKRGHKQDLTIVRVTDILTGGDGPGESGGGFGERIGRTTISRRVRTRYRVVQGWRALEGRPQQVSERRLWLTKRQAVRRATAAIRPAGVWA